MATRYDASVVNDVLNMSASIHHGPDALICRTSTDGTSCCAPPACRGPCLPAGCSYAAGHKSKTSGSSAVCPGADGTASSVGATLLKLGGAAISTRAAWRQVCIEHGMSSLTAAVTPSGRSERCQQPAVLARALTDCCCVRQHSLPT